MQDKDYYNKGNLFNRFLKFFFYVYVFCFALAILCSLMLFVGGEKNVG